MGPETRLKDIPIPHLDVVLDEIFRVPPVHLFPEVARPETVGDLPRHCGQSLAWVTTRLQEIMRMSLDLEIQPQELQTLLKTPGHGAILVDVREDWEYEICHLAGSILLTQATFTALKPQLAAAPTVVTICHHGMRSYSAALFLREQGVPNARSLAGGVDLWAQTIDPNMARY